MSRGRRKWGDNGFEGWGGYMNAKRAKLEDQFDEDARKEGDGGEKKGIFDGVAIFVNGYTDPSSDELKRIMMVNGGTFHHYFNPKKTTHYIATNLPDSKVKALKGDEPICHPRWIVESLEAKKLLDYRKYLLYTAQTKSQPMLKFASKVEKPAEETREGEQRSLNANDSRFLGEFYNNSRLHHISTMGANFKRYVNELREKHDGFFPDRDRLVPLRNPEYRKVKGHLIMHIDMDCFFVSVGLRKRPDLVGKPVAVAHAKGTKEVSPKLAATRKAEMELYRKKYGGKKEEEVKEKEEEVDLVEFSSMSELASCSYEARAKGVKNGMFLGAARKLCPEIQTIPYDFEGYQEVAYVLYNTVAKFTMDIQAVSCDEMLVDVSELLNASEVDPLDFAELLRKEIFEQTQCRASVGLGSSLLLARVATKKAKPDGKFHLKDSEAEAFMKSIPVRDLPGIGRVTSRKFNEMSIETCEQLQQVSLSVLQKEFGAKTGTSFHNFCRGRDDRPMNLNQERKSVSAEVNYGIRFQSEDDWMRFLDQLSGEVQVRLERLGVRGRCVTLKLMVRAPSAPKETSKFMGHGVCDSVSKSSSLATPTSDVAVIRREARLLARQLNARFEDLRGVGIQVSKLDGNTTGVGANALGASGTKSILNFVQKRKSGQAGESFQPQPSTSKCDSVKVERSDNEPESKASEEDDFHLSFSQLDPEVLAELPEDIRKEIESACAKKTKSEPKAEDPKPGPSSIQSKSLLDATFSQIDPEYLAALPSEIADEIRREMAPKKPEQAPTAFSKLMSKSPAKVVTPKRKKRGRPSKNSPRFIKNSAKATKATKPVAQKASRVLFDKPEDTPSAAQQEKETDREENSPPLPPPKREEANLEGRVEVPELLDLLRSWLSSCDRPTEDDVGTVSKFLCRLVWERRLDKAGPLARTIARRTAEMAEGPWREAGKTLIERMQRSMLQAFGYRLATT